MLFNACQSFYFTEPQPKGSAHITQIPNKLQGNFIVMGEIGVESAIYYNVHSKGFVLYEEEAFVIDIDSLDNEELYIKDSLLYIKADDIPEESNGFPFTLKNDTLSGTYCRWEEQLIGKDLVVTQDKGFFYLNSFDEGDNRWECLQVERLKNGDLLMWSIDVKKEEQRMREILKANKIKPEGDDWIASPSKGQFRKFIKKDGFQELNLFLHKLDDDALPELMQDKISARK